MTTATRMQTTLLGCDGLEQEHARNPGEWEAIKIHMYVYVCMYTLVYLYILYAIYNAYRK